VIGAAAEAARAAGALGGWLLKRWWIAPLIGLAIALHLTRGTLADAKQALTNEQAARKADADAAARVKAEREAIWATDGRIAAEAYAARAATREPLVVRSTDTVRTYAQTDAGRAVCHSADRVRGIDALDATLFPRTSEAAGRGADPLPADVGATAAGRVGDQRE
jgi:hypothetical protein